MNDILLHAILGWDPRSGSVARLSNDDPLVPFLGLILFLQKKPIFWRKMGLMCLQRAPNGAPVDGVC